MKEDAIKRPQSKGKTLCWDSFFIYFFSKRRYLSRAFSAKFSSDDGLKSTLRKRKCRLLPGLYDLTWTTVTMSSPNSIIGRYNCACTARRPFCTSLGTGCLRRQNGHPWLRVGFYISKAVKIHRVALPTSQCPRQQWKAAWKAQTIDKIQLPRTACSPAAGLPAFSSQGW